MKLNLYTKCVAMALMASHWVFAAKALPAGEIAVDSCETPAPISLEPDTKRLFALGMIESGNTDSAVGTAGEVSRFQLSPAVWKNYSDARNYKNSELASRVAKLHWAFLAGYFRSRSGRPPTDFDMYVLWNTRFGYYERHHFETKKISRTVVERANRFVNLVNRPEYPALRPTTLVSLRNTEVFTLPYHDLNLENPE